MRAWAQLCTEILAGRDCVQPYTDADYFAHIDGKPRYAGVAGFLASRGIEVPAGEPSDGPEAWTIAGLGNRKNEVFNQVLARAGIAGYPGSIRLLTALQELGLALAVVSSSRNAVAVLAAAGLSEFFGVVVDGNVAAGLGLAGKPAPDSFRYAARELGVAPARAVVLEDALSGVAAGRAGGLGRVVGVDRGAGAAELRAAGADLVDAACADLLP